MANVLCVLASPRSGGYTAALIDSVVEGIKNVGDVGFEVAQITKYLPISPCISCWNCIRNEEHRCTLNDSMGKMGKGELFQKIEKANALVIAQPVYFWGVPAITHLFLERFYPFIFTNELGGMPFASISQAGNQGMARLANTRMTRWAFNLKLRYVGGLPVHMVYFDEAKIRARYLGEKIAEAANVDVEGREKISDLDNFLGAQNNPWVVLEPYIENLTNGTYAYEGSLIEYSLSHGTVKKDDAVELLRKSGEELKLTLQSYRLKDWLEATKHLVKSSAFWTHATYKEFFEDLLKVQQPEAYRPIDE